MKYILGLFILLNSLLFAQGPVPKSFADAKQCLSCHIEQAKDWETTWHSRSHYDSNPLYSSIVDYISKVSYQSIDATLVTCAQCHNPKMSIKDIDDEYSYAMARAFDIETSQVKEIKASVGDTNIKTGISCVICHAVDKIHESKDMKTRGYEAVEWIRNSTIVGPYGGDGRAVFHSSEKRDHFVTSDKLCMVCHYGGENKFNIKLYATGEEYDLVKPIQGHGCADCHMPLDKKGVISPQITKDGINPPIRDIRSHLFAGARNSDILKTTFSLDAKSENDRLVINVKNLTPHKAPTGFSGRSIELKIDFLNGSNVIDTKIVKFEATYQNRRGEETLAYVANKIKSDTRIKPYEQKKISITKPSGATNANIEINYRLVSEEILKLINLKDPTFTKTYNMNFLKVNL